MNDTFVQNKMNGCQILLNQSWGLPHVSATKLDYIAQIRHLNEFVVNVTQATYSEQSEPCLMCAPDLNTAWGGKIRS